MSMLTLREATRQVRDLNEAYDGPGGISLHSNDSGEFVSGYEFHEGTDQEYGYEELPGDGRRADCVGIARRLLAAFRDRVRRETRDQ